MTGAGQTLRRVGPWAWKAALVLGLVAGGWWTAAHGIAGVRWTDVLGVLRALTAWRLVALTAIWLGGLCIYASVLSAALPGLGLRRSLVLNLSGSAVANVVPLGGAVATAMNWRMVRSWGHSDPAFVAFCLLTNCLDVLTKLLLPFVAVLVLLSLSLDVPRALWVLSGGSAAVLVAALVAWALLGRAAAGAGRPLPGWRGTVRAALQESAGRIAGLLVGRWHRLLPASVGYVAAQVVLLFVALRAVGLDVPATAVLTAFAIERIGTLLPLTPGGTGVAEVGAIAWLVAAGLDPVEVVAGVLLYRVFLVALEVPVGGVLLGGWAWLQRGTRTA